ncbi:Diacetyl reductase [(S)-acetoin forming] [Grifola frondosa]|uniref:Diacetyl reductase [(S)-acetoin forming] n=1 Tax=Grifola frondosa TaxID=5627 RepID=A0A1C7M3X2_GRIFR|nr:Diacetyl reductase [(S)-acetoin forming] [Grifola frondosa]
MPLDILFEIFSYLHLRDLLLLNTDLKSIYGLPDCPPFLTEPAYANLVFSPHCHIWICLKDKATTVMWPTFARYCTTCKNSTFATATSYDMKALPTALKNATDVCGLLTFGTLSGLCLTFGAKVSKRKLTSWKRRALTRLGFLLDVPSGFCKEPEWITTINILPQVVDLAYMPEFQALLDAPPTASITRFLALGSELPAFVVRWQTFVKPQLAQLIWKFMERRDGMEPVGLASAVFECSARNQRHCHPEFTNHGLHRTSIAYQLDLQNICGALSRLTAKILLAQLEKKQITWTSCYAIAHLHNESNAVDVWAVASEGEKDKIMQLEAGFTARLKSSGASLGCDTTSITSPDPVMPSKGSVIVTGAASGIGRAIAIRLVQDGFDVALFDLPSSQEHLHALAEEVKQDSGTRTLVVLGDVSVESDVQRLVETVVAEFGGLDVMVANAGIGKVAALHETSVEDIDQLYAVNVRGVFLCYKHAAIQMVKQGRGGRIIGAGSVAGKKGIEAHGAYCATKFAVHGLTQCAALEYGKFGINVNAYAPGMTDTPFLAKLDEWFTNRSGEAKGSWMAQAKDQNALGRLGNPHDLVE